jgi:hypothetical protein
MLQRKLLPLFTFLLLNVFIPKNTVAQQAWTKEKGKFYAQIGASYLGYNQLLNGKISPSEWTSLNAQFTDMTLQAYAEYGLTNHIMVSGQLPFKVLSSKEIVQPNTITEGSLAALSNIQAAVTANFYNQDGIVLSAKTNIGFPTAKFDAPTGLRSGVDAWSAEPSLLAGFGHAKFFASGELGYVLRGNGYSNRIHAAGQIGKFFGKKKKILGIVNVELMKSRDDGTYDDATSSKTGLYLDKQSYLSPTLKLGYKTTDKVTLWLSAGGGLAPITKNIAASPGLTFSISYQN